MGKNTKPMLTALMDGDKLQYLRDYASEREVSMGWVINRLVDRLLAGDINVMDEHSYIDLSKEPIERSSIDKSIESTEKVGDASIDNDRERVENLIKAYIENQEITSIGNSIVGAIEELKGALSDVSKLTSNLQAQIAKVKKVRSESAKESQSPVESTQPKLEALVPNELFQGASSSPMTWAEFHRLVGVAPPPNKEKTKPNAEIALAKAIEMGITGWRFDSTTKKFIPHTPSQPEQTNQH
jgi:hypothetical protein